MIGEPLRLLTTQERFLMSSSGMVFTTNEPLLRVLNALLHKA
jgi:hypothetical protein